MTAYKKADGRVRSANLSCKQHREDQHFLLSNPSNNHNKKTPVLKLQIMRLSYILLLFLALLLGEAVSTPCRIFIIEEYD